MPLPSNVKLVELDIHSNKFARTKWVIQIIRTHNKRVNTVIVNLNLNLNIGLNIDWVDQASIDYGN